MPWYKLGTVAVTANSATVTGTGTAFAANTKVGDAFLGPDGRWYEVTGAPDAITLSIDPPYKGPNANGQAYAIMPVQGYNAYSAALLREITQSLGSFANNSNLNALALTIGAANKGIYFTGPGAMATFDFAALGRAFLAATTPSAQRQVLALGTASTANQQASPTDTTNNTVLTTQGTVGPFGLGGYPIPRRSLAEINADRGSEFFDSNLSTTENPFGAPGAGLHAKYPALNRWGELFFKTVGVSGVSVWARSALGSAPLAAVELLHTGHADALPISGALAPSTDNNRDLGSASRRWGVVRAGTGVINTSDAREKTEVRPLTPAELEAAQDLGAAIGAYRWLEQVSSKRERAREHIGMTVQAAIAILESHGLDPFRYGFICYDSWPQETVEHLAEYEEIEIPAIYEQVRVAPLYDADGNEAIAEHYVDGRELEPSKVERGAMLREAWTEVVQVAGDRYSFRMDELYAFIAAGASQRAKEIASSIDEVREMLDQVLKMQLP